MEAKQDQPPAELAALACYPAVRRYTITLEGGGEASFGYCGKEPLTEDFLRAMKAMMEAAADSVRRDELPDSEPALALGGGGKPTPKQETTSNEKP